MERFIFRKLCGRKIMQTFIKSNNSPRFHDAIKAGGASNKAVNNILRAGVQPKLKIGAVNDPAEVEADRVADQVMRMPAPANEGAKISTKANPSYINRKCKDCGNEEKIQRKETPDIRMKEMGGAGGHTASAEASSAINSLGSGMPLPASERAFFEPRFGKDLSHIRVHTGGTADTASQSINARAFSLGNNIAFANGQYQPGTQSGRTLMAHEITHTLQGGQNVRRVAWNDDKSNCTTTATYTVQTIFKDHGTDTWTAARKRAFRTNYKRVVEAGFNANNYRISPLTRAVGSSACDCHGTGFLPRLEIQFTPIDDWSTSEDLEVDVLANPSGSFIRSSQNTTFGYGYLDEADVINNGRQTPAVHEFGHFLGLNHPGHGLSASQLSAGATEYSHVGKDQYSRDVDGTVDLLGQGMGLRPFYFNSWINHIKDEYNRFCMYDIR